MGGERCMECVGCGNVFIFAYILKGEDNEQFEV